MNFIDPGWQLNWVITVSSDLEVCVGEREANSFCDSLWIPEGEMNLSV